MYPVNKFCPGLGTTGVHCNKGAFVLAHAELAVQFVVTSNAVEV